MLARADVICVDKTGTITNGEMDFKKLLLYGPNSYSHSDVVQIVSNVLLATKDDNLTAKALRKYFDYDLTKGVVEALPFNSVNKYSAATFKGEGTFVLGAAEYLNIQEQTALRLRTEEYTSLGNMVLVLGKAERLARLAGFLLYGKCSLDIFLFFWENCFRAHAASATGPALRSFSAACCLALRLMIENRPLQTPF